MCACAFTIKTGISSIMKREREREREGEGERESERDRECVRARFHTTTTGISSIMNGRKLGDNTMSLAF